MKARRSHRDLGVGQEHSRAMGHFGFAPCVIEGPSRRRWVGRRGVEALAGVLLVLALLGLLAACLGFSTGYLLMAFEQYWGVH